VKEMGTRGTRRFSKDDFGLLPNTLMVNEARCVQDPEYRHAIEFVESAEGGCLNFEEAHFLESKEYRDAVNMIASEVLSPTSDCGSAVNNIAPAVNNGTNANKPPGKASGPPPVKSL